MPGHLFSRGLERLDFATALPTLHYTSVTVIKMTKICMSHVAGASIEQLHVFAISNNESNYEFDADVSYFLHLNTYAYSIYTISWHFVFDFPSDRLAKLQAALSSIS